MIELLKAVLFGVVQGITEWLPISSTGHMILLDEFLTLDFPKAFVDTFLVVVQLGSILAVVALYFHKLNPLSTKKDMEEKRETWILWSKVLLAVVPAGVIGVLFEDAIHERFYNSTTVAIALIVYGIIFILIENQRRLPRFASIYTLTYKTAFAIGLFQVLALIPGTSRSGSTILGAILLGTSRTLAAEFSFFMAIPIMAGASFLKLLRAGFAFNPLEWAVLMTGSAVAFAVSWAAIRFLLNYIRRHDFKFFGYYRIVLGLVVLAYFGLIS